ncbi:MAG: PPC domain-containing DNA-binding protein [Bacillota bacterium]
MATRPATPGRCFIGRLGHGDDLLAAVEAVARENGIAAGTFQCIGALTKAAIGYYHQDRREYETITCAEHMEIVWCGGNISQRDGKPAVHGHIILADATGAAFGGHLLSGNGIFACELFVQELTGVELERAWDETTGLPLWRP